MASGRRPAVGLARRRGHARFGFRSCRSPAAARRARRRVALASCCEGRPCRPIGARRDADRWQPLLSRLEPENPGIARGHRRRRYRNIRAQLPATRSQAPAAGASRATDAFVSRGAGRFGFAKWGYHANHVHPQGWISSALYLALPDHSEANSDRLRDGSSWVRHPPSSACRPATGPAD